ncbi:hypothetical protein RBSH_00245 [Rhodopirellula baltica SH28]|uniref:Uncharacterized protein n=1 Tax=Rhodopirellula baltica SH28 TaxID=993517 RepID=K5EES1_RHOBT|nr:hypothetical protein RBSH_00245 [Rhodopirellula baltica SH28]
MPDRTILGGPSFWEDISSTASGRKVGRVRGRRTSSSRWRFVSDFSVGCLSMEVLFS